MLYYICKPRGGQARYYAGCIIKIKGKEHNNVNFAVKKIEFEFEENTSTSKKVKFYSLFEMALKKYASRTAFKLEEEGIEFDKKVSFNTVITSERFDRKYPSSLYHIRYPARLPA